MKAKEFIVEYKLSVSKDDSGVAVKATAGGKPLGHAEFFFDEQGNLDPQTVWVDERYHGQGIARDMYDHLKGLGYTIVRSWDQTDAGKGFWDKHRGEDARIWEGAPSSNLNGLHNKKTYQQTLQALQTAYGNEEGQQMLDQYIQAVDQLIHSGGTVYRGIWVAPGTKPRLKDAGQHWALTLPAAEEYLDSDAGWGAYADFQGDNDDIQPEPYIISATVGPNSITNKGVLFAQFPEELEVRLVNPQTAKMKIVKKVKGLV